MKIDEQIVDYLMDCDSIGRPLIISFSFAFWDKPCDFDFVGRLNKIEGLYGKPFNKIFLRDRYSQWYQRGVYGLGDCIDEVAAALKIEIEAIRPSFIVTIGQSMGGYAALVFGALLGAHKIISFAPLSFIDARRLKLFGDHRYYQALIKLEEIEIQKKYLDVLGLFDDANHHSDIHVIFGADMDAGRELVHMDSMHALRLQSISRCTVHAFEGVGHLVVKHLSDHRMMDSFLLKHIFNYEMEGKAVAGGIEYGWSKWIFDNLVAGASTESLIEAIEKSNCVNKSELIDELTQATTSPYIKAAKELKLELDKRNWLLNTYDQLAALDSRYSGSIEVREVPDFESFLLEYYSKGLPVILKGGIDSWPALKKWNPSYFRSNYRDRIVEVQYGRGEDLQYEQNAVKYKKMMTMSAFCDLVEGCDSSNDFYLTANNTGASLSGLDGLFDDVGDFGVGYRDLKNIKSSSFLWFGPKGTVTQLHHDLTNNMLVQIFGRKKITLIPAFQVPYMYNKNHVYSSVALPEVDLNQFPDFKKTTPIEIVLAPGDALFIPIGWWHYVESLDVSISVSFTDFNLANNFYLNFPRRQFS